MTGSRLSLSCGTSTQFQTQLNGIVVLGLSCCCNISESSFFFPLSLSLSPFRLFSYLLGEFVFIYIPPGDVLRIAGRGRDVCVRVSRYALNYCPLTNMGARDRKSNRSRSKIDYEMMEEDGTRVRITTVNVANNQNSD